MPQSPCQVCGNPMYSQNYYGTEEDGSLNSAFCSNCYKGGKFHSSQSSQSDLYNSNETFVDTNGFIGMYPNSLGRGNGFFVAAKK